MIAYKIVMEPDTNGTLLVSCPDLPGVNTYGDDREDALRHAVDAIETWIASLIGDNLDVPHPKKVRPRANEALVPLSVLATLKLELYWALKGSDLTRADLMRALHWNRNSVDRLFQLDHNSRIDQIEEAFEAMNLRIDPVIATLGKDRHP